MLQRDHTEVHKLFKQYEKLAKAEAPAAEREALAKQICTLVRVHAQIEEEIFYPAARQAQVEDDLMDEADVEHASAKELIAQIESMQADDDHYDAKLKVLGEYIDHHVEEEQNEMFPKCRKATARSNCSHRPLPDKTPTVRHDGSCRPLLGTADCIPGAFVL